MGLPGVIFFTPCKWSYGSLLITGFWTHLGSCHKGFVYAAQLGVVVSERMQKLPNFKHIRTFIGAPFHPS